MTKAEQITELTTKLSRYEAMMAAADSIHFPYKDEPTHFQSVSKYTGCGTAMQHLVGQWRVNAEDYEHPSPLEAFEALEKERV